MSVILPVFNGERYIEEAIKSILSQTFNDFELIIINDGSTDGTSRILRRYRGVKNTKVLEFPRRIGLVKALKAGIKLSEGKLIARQDADDVSCPNRLEEEVKLLLGGNFDLVSCLVKFVKDDGGEISGKLREDYEFFYNSVVDPNEISLRLPAHNCIIHGSVLFRKTSYLLAGGYSDRYPHVEDYYLWLRMEKIGRFGKVKKHLYVYRFHKDQIVSVVNRKDRYRQTREALKAKMEMLIEKFPYVSKGYIHGDGVGKELYKETFKVWSIEEVDNPHKADFIVILDIRRFPSIIANLMKIYRSFRKTYGNFLIK